MLNLKPALSVFFAAAASVLSACAVAGGGKDARSSRLDVGAQTPALVATDQNGKTVTLGVPGPVRVIYFYPKDGTPGCTAEACAFRDVWDQFTDAGVDVVGVSSNNERSHRTFAEKHALPFSLIADPKGIWSQAFGVATTFGITHRVSFLIDRDGKVAHVYPGVDPALHAEEVLGHARNLQ